MRNKWRIDSLWASSADGAMTAFSITDCPKLVDDEFFYLANKPGTPLLRKNAIYRGADSILYPKLIKYGKIRYMDFTRGIEFGLFDLISASDEYLLVYRNGGTIIALRDVRQIYSVRNAKEQNKTM